MDCCLQCGSESCSPPCRHVRHCGVCVHALAKGARTRRDTDENINQYHRTGGRMILEGDAASLSDVGGLGDEWGFTLYDVLAKELLAFALHTKQAARTAHKMLSPVVIKGLANA